MNQHHFVAASSHQQQSAVNSERTWKRGENLPVPEGYYVARIPIEVGGVLKDLYWPLKIERDEQSGLVTALTPLLNHEGEIARYSTRNYAINFIMRYDPDASSITTNVDAEDSSLSE